MNSSFMKNLLSPQPQTGQQVVDQNVNNGIQQAQDEHQAVTQMQQANRDQQVAQAAQQQTIADISNLLRRENDIINFKQSYADAEKAGDIEGMNASREGAALYRDLLSKNNENVDGMGADDSLAQALARRNFNRTTMLNQALSNTMTSGQMYDDSYTKYRNSGLNDRSARFYATQDAKKYQDKLMGDLQSVLFSDGLNERGGLNAQGTQALNMMFNEKPDATAYLLQSLPSLANEYAFQTGQLGKDNDVRRAKDMGGNTLANQIALMGAQTENAKDIANNAANNQLQTMSLQGSINAMLKNLDTDDQIKLMQFFKDNGIPFDAKGKPTDNKSKLNSAQAKMDNTFDVSFKNLERAIAKARIGNSATDEENDALNNLNASIDEMEASGEFDKDSIDEYREKAQQLGNSLQRKYHYPEY